MKISRASLTVIGAGWIVMGCAGAIAQDPLHALSDEFDDAGTLSQWRRVYQTEGWGFDQLERWDINTTRSGWMLMMPHTSSWYQEWRGVQVYKPVTGDFVVTIEVEARNRAGDGPPDSQYSLAGIMVRSPRPGLTQPSLWTPNGENYVFLSTGSADQPGTYQFEVKTTGNSTSVLEISPALSNRVRIQIAKIGPYVIALRRFEGGNWTVHRRYTRADMPATLNVGLTTYTDWATCSSLGYPFHNTHLLTNGLPLDGGGTLTSANPGLSATFDYIRYQRPQVPVGLEGRNFADPGQVSDAQLLAFLGEQANVPGGSTTPARIVSSHYEIGTGLSMTLEVRTNRSYRVEYRLDVGQGPWTSLTNFISTEVMTSVLDPGATGSVSRFYRVVSP